MKGFSLHLILALVLTILCLSVFAEDSSEENKEGDQILTNRMLRASTGSLSKWSAALRFNYSGGSVDQPLKPQRPNIVSAGDALVLANMTGDVGFRYRIDAKQNIGLSTGIFMSTPFHNSITTPDNDLRAAFDKNKQKLKVNNPFITHTYLAKLGGVQSVTTSSLTFITDSRRDGSGYREALAISQNFLYDIGTSGLTLGMLFAGTQYTHGFDEKFDPKSSTVKNVKADQTDYVIGAYPFLEYVINDTFNLRTIWGALVYENFRNMDTFHYKKRPIYQSVGLGIAISRDLFIYPNIQFMPEDIRNDRTNVAMSATINI
jgi:hypothetical protein